MIHHITLRALAHATEDVFRVQKALKFFVSNTSVRDSELIEELQSEGHHGNPITILSCRLTGRQIVYVLLVLSGIIFWRKI